MESTVQESVSSKPHTLIWLVVGMSVLLLVCKAIYNLYFHPLAHIPGPRLAALSRISHIRHLLAGTTVQEVNDLHQKYGDLVRFSPNEVSFISGDTAWPDIYGFRTGKLAGHSNMAKDPVWYVPPMNGVPSVLTADDADHSRMRRILAHAFSEKALSAQENLLQSYVDQLVDRIGEQSASSSTPLDMVYWFNACTFDVISDLLFGEPFGSLQSGSLHKYVELVFRTLRAAPLFYVMHYWPWARWLGSFVISKKALQDRLEFHEWVSLQTRKRLDRETARPDFMTYVQKHNETKPDAGISDEEIETNSILFITAGSETTATLLSGALYLLLKNPEVFEKLQSEVRGSWKAFEEINLEEVNKSKYLIAVLSEALRYFPPVPTGFPRRVPPGGETISGQYIPEGTAVCMSSYPAHHSERNFLDADKFIPERWMGDARYAGDKRSGCQPFSFGPRNCLGKNLAYAEMRLILAKVVWTFDFELDARSENWMDECRVAALWEKPPLWCRAKNIRV